MKKNIYLIYGEEKFLIDKYNEEIINKTLIKDFLDFNLIKFESKKLKFDSILNTLETLPLFDENKIIIIDDLDTSKKGISTNSEFINKLHDYIDTISNYNNIIINSYLDKPFKGKFFKKIKKVGSLKQFKKLNYSELKNYIKEFFTQNSLDYNLNTIDYIIDKTAYLNKDFNKNLYNVNNELEKLKNIKVKINKEIIDDVFTNSFENNIFKLTDAISTKNISDSIRIYNELLINSNDPFRIFYMIVRLIRNILIIKESTRLNLTEQNISKNFSISNFEIKKLKAIINRWKYDTLKLGIHNSYKTEVLLKSTSVNPNYIVENYMINLLR
ncbi:DNA polymerase III subunit delta [Miniphocaeibacter halophilus]|uniref:DNA polymerase III subunit delta n=1 Tax=Miniphocaeibacter halophilus TaxID=2931922 RepID=A0AC61MQ60_9FIRM|nr:DNA polymerase III subunit delta [Miniphocaeibacter halophilus]QQK07652.1 DNA polymerase III subunit delta [Miniphocaeibacter halophilus]